MYMNSILLYGLTRFVLMWGQINKNDPTRTAKRTFPDLQVLLEQVHGSIRPSELMDGVENMKHA